ncbi:glucose-1-phosphate thymidylyltransferase [Thermocrinis albus DSM 14484]|uniref:Glucose-1-phosphate thymidylyltransferase n=1 Tax=Thermocrinis albus (strain DSM 14484 / JCM 11386 / HI 11/12) TaxID=638303 RepID=D3SMW4_THEAH|nr:glucose-1-phosphate thymidylyltransferase RfbA [Thermocrinis albus]ADC90094.1 glucose-1-phosphate thymidylyltransferase [Thermocrinis albus DSM 14484]
MKGIVLAGGSGTRLYPVTQVVNKHLLPIYNKPMIYYSLSLVMLAGIREVVIVINPSDEPFYRKLLKDGSHLGMRIEYSLQEAPLGLTHAIMSTRDLVGENPAMVVLGDNILYGHNLGELFRKVKDSVEREGGAYVFGYHVQDPTRFGVVEFDQEGRVLSIEEKPQKPKSNFAVIGIYFFDITLFEKGARVKPSARGEYEITSLLEEYLKEGSLRVSLLGRGFAWFDAGTHSSFLEAGNFVQTIEEKTGYMLGAVEEIAYRNGWINREELKKLACLYQKTGYGEYLLKVAEEETNIAERLYFHC